MSAPPVPLDASCAFCRWWHQPADPQRDGAISITIGVCRYDPIEITDKHCDSVCHRWHRVPPVPV